MRAGVSFLAAFAGGRGGFGACLTTGFMTTTGTAFGEGAGASSSTFGAGGVCSARGAGGVIIVGMVLRTTCAARTSALAGAGAGLTQRGVRTSAARPRPAAVAAATRDRQRGRDGSFEKETAGGMDERDARE